MPIYASFTAANGYFSRSTATRTESFWNADNCKLYEWFLKTANKGEKIGLDRAGNTWFYERWGPETDHQLTVKTWLKAGVEWGVVVRKYADREVREAWSLDRGSKSYELVEVGEKASVKRRYGFTPLADGPDEWTEYITEAPDEVHFEKKWNRPGAKGGETRDTRSNSSSGKVWFEQGSDYEEKVWHISPSREWGYTTGCRGSQHYDEKWDSEGQDRTDTKEYSDGPRQWGSKHEVQGSNWRKVEWEGMRPEAASAPPEYSHKLFATSSEALQHLLESEKTLEAMICEDFSADFSALKERRSQLPTSDAEHPEGSIKVVAIVLGMLHEHEVLKRAIVAKNQVREACEMQKKLKELVDLQRNQLAELGSVFADDIQFKEALGKIVEKHSQLNSQGDARSILLTLDLLKSQLALEQEFSAQRLKAAKCEFALKEVQLQEELSATTAQRQLKIDTGLQSLQRAAVVADAVCELLATAVKDDSVIAKLAEWRSDMEKVSQSVKDSSDLGEAFSLLAQYQPTMYTLAGKLLGLDPTHVAEDYRSLSNSGNRHTKRPTTSIFQYIDDKLNYSLGLAGSVLVALTEDDGSAAVVTEVLEATGELVPTILRKLDVLRELLDTMSSLEVVEESTNTETQNVSEETKEDSTSEKQTREIEKLSKEVERKDALLKELSAEVRELREEHEKNKQLSADLAVLQADNLKLQKQLEDLKSSGTE